MILTGGSAYGLATADGVMPTLAAAGRGFPVGPDPDIRTPGLAMDERRASWPAITALPLRAKSANKGEATASGDAGVPGEVAGFGG